MKPMTRRGRLWLALVTVAAGLFCAVIVLVPLAQRNGSAVAPWLRLAFRPACHQIADRCLDLGSGSLPVCARCAGLYVGGLLGLAISLIANRRVQPGLGLFIAATIPSAFDLALGPLGLPNLPNWPRFGISILPGLVLGLLLACAVADLGSSGNDEPTTPRIT